VLVVRVHGVVLLLRPDANILQPLHYVPSSSPHFGEWIFLNKGLSDRSGPLENQAGVNAVKVSPVGRFHGLHRGTMLEGKIIHKRPTVGCNPHEGNVRQFTVELQQEDFQGPPGFGIILLM
jgi:hypothetical protein